MNAPIAITMGDAAGIGPEIIVKAFQHAGDLAHACFVVGDVQTLRRATALCTAKGDLPWPVARIGNPTEALQMPPRCIPVLQPGEDLAAVPYGVVNAAAGELAGRCIVWAAEAAMRGEVGAIVTAPIHKEALSAAGAPYNQYPGHTEMLQAVAARALGQSVDQLAVRMMLANLELRTVLVSIHLSLRDAIDAVSTAQVLETILITHRALSKTLGRAPRIGVAGLNPHAGEGGLFGREEIELIRPAVIAACDQGCLASGPWAPDTVFMRARTQPNRPGEFDAVIAMYHDQGLIPVKYLGVEQGVNVTLGLPFVRTSPDHGTAFDIAGTGVADAASLLQALRVAREMATF